MSLLHTELHTELHRAPLLRTRQSTAVALVDDLWRMADADDFVETLRRSAHVRNRARRSDEPVQLVDQLASLATEGVLASLLAIETLGAIAHPDAGDALVELLAHPTQLVRRHASWRLGARRCVAAALPLVLDELARGGIDTMHAHRAMRRWSIAAPALILRHVTARLATVTGASGRARLVDVLGVVGDRSTDDVLVRLAADPGETTAARVAAIGALGERPGDVADRTLRRLAGREDPIGAHAASAIRRPGADPDRGRVTGGGLRIAQLTLAGGLDGELSLGGRGDTGGVASLLVSLGAALARRTDVEHVVTIGRGTSAAAAAVTRAHASDRPPAYGTLAIGDADRPVRSPDDGWEHLPTIERELRRVLRVAAPVDVLHLRMADAGTLAGAAVAAAAGIPICFSLAADPHNVLHSLQARGELGHESFLRLDTDSHVWFRARLVEHLARRADRLALFPHARPAGFLDVVAPGASRPGQRTRVVAEGIDIGMLRRAGEPTAAAAGTEPGSVLDDLAARIPPDRHHLPLLLSVGRLHPVKGMERIAAAWASDPRLSEMCNLVIVGGALDDPSPVEREVLDAIDRAVPTDDPRRRALVMLGGRPRADVARLLAATATGRPGGWAPGVYVDGALKEEFGLAVIEALAVGLVVTAPDGGGPATYVDHGDTGILVGPRGDLAGAIRDSFALVDRPGRAQRAIEMVEQRYSIDTMAAQLVSLYRAGPP